MERDRCLHEWWRKDGAAMGREEGLPVHRHNHGKRGTVFAFRSEIQDWMTRRDTDVARSATTTGYSNLGSAELAKRCEAARSRAEKARRIVAWIYEQHQAEIVRLQERLKQISSQPPFRHLNVSEEPSKPDWLASLVTHNEEPNEVHLLL